LKNKKDIIEALYVTDDFKYTYTGENINIRVYHTLNIRFILEDMFAKLTFFTRGEI